MAKTTVSQTGTFVPPDRRDHQRRPIQYTSRFPFLYTDPQILDRRQLYGAYLPFLGIHLDLFLRETTRT